MRYAFPCIALAALLMMFAVGCSNTTDRKVIIKPAPAPQPVAPVIVRPVVPVYPIVPVVPIPVPVHPHGPHCPPHHPHHG